MAPRLRQSEGKQAHLEYLLSFLEQLEQEYWYSAQTTHPIYRAWYVRNEANPENYFFHAATAHGLLCGNAMAYEDAQSGGIAGAPSVSVSFATPQAIAAFAPAALEQHEPTLTECWANARDEKLRATERAQALLACLTSDGDGVAAYLTHELSRGDTADEWRNALVFVAEDTYFSNPEWRHSIRDRLMEIAASARMSVKAGSDQVAWSALRRATSLLDPADAKRLLPFLDRRGPVDTLLVALQCVYRLFEAEPPTDREGTKLLGDRIADCARKFLDPDVFSGGENAAIALHAVCALAALADSRLEDVIAQVNNLQRRWLSRQTKLRLGGLLHAWRLRNPAVVSHEAFRLVEANLGVLR